ncbi:MAG TPA: hypothetical protein VL096_00795 [Pirellulaceae bacterium]|nr:hypothetical protein [Pirellulaceae bacterium]
MSVESSITLLTSLVGIGVAILMAGIPWAYVIHGRLTKIEVNLQNYVRNVDRLDDVLARLARLELRNSPPHVGE